MVDWDDIGASGQALVETVLNWFVELEERVLHDAGRDLARDGRTS